MYIVHQLQRRQVAGWFLAIIGIGLLAGGFALVHETPEYEVSLPGMWMIAGGAGIGGMGCLLHPSWQNLRFMGAAGLTLALLWSVLLSTMPG